MEKFINTIFNIIRKIMLILFFIILLFFITHITNKDISVSHYNIKAEVPSAFRIVQLTDYHNSELSKDNKVLIDKVKKHNPDIIILSGDFINSFDESTENAEKLITELSKITDVYFGYGNHEYSWEKNYGKSIYDIFTNAGAKVLNNTYIDLNINGSDVRIGGYMGYYRIPHMISASEEEMQEQNVFFDDFENTDRYKILINHIPTAWVDWGYTEHPVDLVFSGHYHGGQWNLPFIGGVYAPYIGFNPPFVKGVYKGEYATIILSSGLGNEHRYLPRINNPPEIVVVDVQPIKKDKE